MVRSTSSSSVRRLSWRRYGGLWLDASLVAKLMIGHPATYVASALASISYSLDGRLIFSAVAIVHVHRVSGASVARSSTAEAPSSSPISIQCASGSTSLETGTAASHRARVASTAVRSRHVPCPRLLSLVLVHLDKVEITKAFDKPARLVSWSPISDAR
jgi:hypothetical protein